jgi:signal transduction histidine kinase
VAFAIFSIAALEFLPAYKIPIPPYTYLAGVIFTIILAHSIVYHKFLDPRPIAVEIFTALIGLIFLVELIIAPSLPEKIFRGGILVIFLFLGYQLIRTVLREMAQREQLEKSAHQIKRYAHRLEKMNKQLQKLLVMRSEFLDIASHQLRTPVSVINGFLSMWQEGDIQRMPPAEQKKFVQGVLAKGRKLENIINDILSASEMDSVDFVVKGIQDNISLEEVIEDVIKEFKPLAEKKNISLEFIKPTAKLPPLQASRHFLNQALSNLVDNAIRYTSHGGVKIKAWPEKDRIMVEVSDTGMGIPREDLPKLFGKFQRARNARNLYPNGSGLGLFIVKKIIEGHLGKIWVEKTELNKGTTFRFYLPLGLRDKLKKLSESERFLL